MQRRFLQIDVFTTTPYRGNPVAVVLDSDGLTTEEMQRFAHWTNLSETTFVTPPTDAGADYGVRIFTPSRELPFAGHPTLGTCHAWLTTDPASGASAKAPGASGASPGAELQTVVQECGVGLVEIRRTPDGLAFAAPPLVRSGPVEEPEVQEMTRQLNLDPADIQAAEWVDNGPGWAAVLLADADAVLAVRPGPVDRPLGVVGPYPPGSPYAYEVRAFFNVSGQPPDRLHCGDGHTVEDPVTGSLNASLAQWLVGAGRAETPYVVSQGGALGRAGRVHISTDEDGTVWVGGGTVTCITGHVEL